MLYISKRPALPMLRSSYTAAGKIHDTVTAAKLAGTIGSLQSMNLSL
jgi:hypothetical protein